VKDVECPYCGEWQEINHDDGYGYDESLIHEQQCRDCENSFAFTTYISFSYDAKKADCMNGEPHNFKPTCTAPKYYTKMRCSGCGEERKMLEHEWLDFMKPMEVISGYYY